MTRLEACLDRIKKIILREITRKLIRDSTLKCFGRKRKKGYRSVVVDIRLEFWFLEEGSVSVYFEIKGYTARGQV